MKPLDRKLSHTSTATFRRCKLKYKRSYIENFDPPAGLPLIKGSVGHAGLGAWYQALANKPDAQEEASSAALQAASDELTKYEQKAGYDMPDVWDDMAVILERYFEWALENDDFEAQEIEHKFNVPIGDYMITGFIDGVIQRDNGTNWILEHKFTKQVRVKHLELDPQISLYMLAARASGFDIRGAFYNVIRTTIRGKAETEPVVRLPVYRNNEALEYTVHELIWQMREMQAFHDNEGEFAYRTITMDCSWDCGFFESCLAINDDGDPTPALRIIPIKEYERTKG